MSVSLSFDIYFGHQILQTTVFQHGLHDKAIQRHWGPNSCSSTHIECHPTSEWLVSSKEVRVKLCVGYDPTASGYVPPRPLVLRAA